MQVKHNSIMQLIIIAISLLFGYRALVTVVDMWQRRSVVDNAKTQYNQLLKENEDLKQKLKEIQTPEYVEKIAREKFGYVKDGEAIVLMQGTGDRVQGTENVNNHPNWKQWWNLFF